MEIKIIRYPDFSDTLESVRLPHNGECDMDHYRSNCKIADSDLKLLSKLVKAGAEHAKSIRGTWVTLKITAPRYWWSEFDTYKVGVQTLSSTSTMHKITSRDLVKSDFENAHVIPSVLRILNKIRSMSSLTNTEKLVEMKKILPEAFLQTRVVQINYQALRNIYKQRKHHRLVEWQAFCAKVDELPYVKELITVDLK